MPERVPPNPPPRYDDTFFRGTAWLDSMDEPEESWVDQCIRENPWKFRWYKFWVDVEYWPLWLWITDCPMADGYRYRSGRPNPLNTQS